jgi:hypothetical protein
MSTLVNTIKEVAGFAAAGQSGMFEMWLALHFRPGEVFAQDGTLGARMPVDLDLTCGVDAAKLVKALKVVTGEPKFTQEKDQLVIRAGTSTIKLPSMSAEVAPIFYRPPTKAAWVEVSILGEVENMSWCTNASRMNMSGVNLAKSGLQVTNSHAAIIRGGANFEKMLGRQVLVAPKLFKGLPQTVWLAVHDNLLFVAKDPEGTEFRSGKMVDGQFPPVDELLKEARTYPTASVPRDILIDVVKRALVGSHDGMLKFGKGRLGVSVGGNKAQFDFLDSVALTDSSIKPCEMGMNLEYLLGTLEVCPAGDVLLRCQSEMAPLGVSGGDVFSAVMPTVA